MKYTRDKRGFALILVLLLVAAGVVLGTSYLSAAAVRSNVSTSYKSLSRARYVSESGLQHGIYLLRDQTLQINNTGTTSLGTFAIESGCSDSYTISVTPAGNGQYTLQSDSLVNGVKRTSSMVVSRAVNSTNIKYGMLVGAGPVWLSSGVTLTGDIQCNSGILYNFGSINGTATSVGGILNYGYIKNKPPGIPPAQPVPQFNVADYASYTLNGVACSAKTFTGNNPPSGAITQTNPGGVVYCTGTGITLGNNTTINGTLIINGDVTLDGNKITINPVSGFPAIVCSGSLKINTGCKNNGNINGVVAAAKGIVPNGDKNTAMTINGAVVSQTLGMVSGLGAYNINYQSANLYSFGTQSQATVSIVKWND